jgi:orotate phosphoribosyltransferase
MLSVKHDILQKAMVGLLHELGLVIEGHFDFGNGYHGDTYLNAHPMLDDPYRIMQLAHEMKEVVPADLREQVDIVVGPITGGALLAANLAIVLDNERKPTAPRVRFAPVYKVGNELALRTHYQTLIAGKIGQPGGLRALVVDDVCNTGHTIRKTRRLIEEYGGTNVGSVVLYDRQNSSVDIDNHFFMAQVNLGKELVPVGECSCQRIRMDITKF